MQTLLFCFFQILFRLIRTITQITPAAGRTATAQLAVISPLSQGAAVQEMMVPGTIPFMALEWVTAQRMLWQDLRRLFSAVGLEVSSRLFMASVERG